MTGWAKGRGSWLAVAVLALGAPEATTAAQQTGDDCRCVDADGNAVADCTCFRMPESMEAMAPFALAFGRPRLGISVSTEQGSELDAQGAEVTNVLEDGPAWEAGIREGDVITSIDGQSLFEPLEGDREEDFDLDQSIPVQRLLAIARELEPGEEVEVSYLRDGQQGTATLTAEDLTGRSFGLMRGFDAERLSDQLGALRRDLPRFRGQGGALDDGYEAMLRGSPGAALFFDGSRFGRYGLELVELNAGLGQYFGTEQGVLVVDVSEDSELGLQPGDVILRIGDRDTPTPDRALRVLGSYDADEDISLHIRRNGREVSVMGRVGG